MEHEEVLFNRQDVSKMIEKSYAEGYKQAIEDCKKAINPTLIDAGKDLHKDIMKILTK